MPALHQGTSKISKDLLMADNPIHGQLEQTVGGLRKDITQRKLMEEALEKSFPLDLTFEK